MMMMKSLTIAIMMLMVASTASADICRSRTVVRVKKVCAPVCAPVCNPAPVCAPVCRTSVLDKIRTKIRARRCVPLCCPPAPCCPPVEAEVPCCGAEPEVVVAPPAPAPEPCVAAPTCTCADCCVVTVRSRTTHQVAPLCCGQPVRNTVRVARNVVHNTVHHPATVRRHVCNGNQCFLDQ